MQEEKKKLRRQILQLRNELTMDERSKKSEIICQKLYEMPYYKQAEILLAFVNYQSEVITIPLIEKAISEGKKVFCPKVIGEEMEFYEIKAISELLEGYRGIKEPEAIAEKLYVPEAHKASVLMLMPGVAFDRNRYRIGYGKGFYDRYLEKYEKYKQRMTTIALAFSCQMVEKVPVQPHDIRPDVIITEKERILA